MAGRGTGQQRAAETLRQQAVAEEQQLQAENAGDQQQQQQPAGAQGADMGVMQTPPAQQQQQQPAPRMLPDTALRALSINLHGCMNDLRGQVQARDRQQEERDGRMDAEFARLSQENSALRGLITQLQQEVGGARSEIETQLRPFAVQRIHELRQRVDQLQLALMQQQPSLSAITPQLIESIVQTVTDKQLGVVMDGLASLGTTLLRSQQAGGQQEEGDDEPTPAELEALEQAERRLQQIQQARQESAMRQPPPPPAPAPAPAAPMPPPPAAPIFAPPNFAPPAGIPPEPVKTGPWQLPPPPPLSNPYSIPPLAMPAPATGYEQGIRNQNPRDPRFRPVPPGPPQFSTAGKGGRPSDRGAEQANKRPRGDQPKHPGSKAAMHARIAELNSIIGQLAPSGQLPPGVGN